ncbi:MAG: hypothetical protein ACYC27_07135 [Armatimonadota bacterium]
MGVPINVSASDIESVILSLSDISSACVVTSKTGIIEEVHVLTSATRAPKQIVRDIESALMAKYGIELDHKKISIAQTNSGKQFRFVGSRVKFSDVSISLNGAKGDATVHLKRNDDVFTGAAAGHCSNQNQLRLIASATLKAVEDSLGRDISLILEDLTIVSLSGKDVVVVFVTMITPRSEDNLTGSAIVKQDVWKAVVNASLDSINRRLGTIDED